MDAWRSFAAPPSRAAIRPPIDVPSAPPDRGRGFGPRDQDEVVERRARKEDVTHVAARDDAAAGQVEPNGVRGIRTRP